MTRAAPDLPARLEAALVRRFAAAADPTRAAAMKAYMREQFPFLGIPKDVRVTLEREAFVEALDGPRAAKGARAQLTEDELVAVTRRLFAHPEREYAYAALALLRRHVPRVGTPRLLDEVEGLLRTRPWWDTVDELAQHAVGTLVAKHPALVATMDVWARSPDLWIARAAILHQNRYRARTDARRLFAHCLLRAKEKDFFFRKAIGWALRAYAATDPDAVARFCDAHADVLSGLSLREARRGVERARAAPRARTRATKS